MSAKPADIKKAAVLGSGVMGSAIAAHLANAGIPSILFDIVPRDLPDGASAAQRNAIAAAGLKAATKAKPAAFYRPEFAGMVEIANFDDDLERLGECDWVCEVVVERMDIKQSLFARVDEVRKPGSVISSNTSGLSLAGMIEGRSDDFRKNFLVTHFFNPPRYMKLLEIVAGEETDAAMVARMSAFFEHRLGKGVVFAKDTPNFIANRIGTFSMLRAIHLMLEEGYTVEEVDAIAGTPMGRPKSAAFRTADVVGIDTLAHVARNCYDSLVDDERRETFKMPEFVDQMVAKGLIGQKVKAGFYKKDRATGVIHAIDPKTLEYHEKAKVRMDSIGAARGIEDVGERIKAMVNAEDRGGQFAWKVTAETLIYAATRLGEIADDVVNVDRAMRWGFNWDLGPFETIDALGVAETVERMKKDGYEVPELFEKVAASPAGKFYVTEGGSTRYFDVTTGELTPEPEREGVTTVAQLKAKAGGVVRKNDDASLIDIGDGVALLEFHSKANSIGPDVVIMLNEALDEVEQNFEGLVIANDGQHFSVGANLMLIYLEAQQQNWDGLDEMIKAFQDTCQRLSTSSRPVVVAPHSLVLGGGCEVSMGANRMVASAETYMGLVEVGVGLIPGGGGNKELLRRIMQNTPAEANVDPFGFVAHATLSVGMAKVATSADEARRMGFLTDSDRIVLSGDRLVTEAKAEVLHMARDYAPRRLASFKLPGTGGLATIMMQFDSMRAGGFLSEHDMRIGKALATVMTGGECSPNVPVSEQYLLDIEREQFLSLCGEEKTQARMQHMLMKNKPLRN